MKPHRRPIPALVLVAILVGARSFAADAPKPMTAILGATNREVRLLTQSLDSPSTFTVRGIPFHLGALKGRQVLLAATGVGKVNAAMTTTLLLDHFEPKEVLFTGKAGGINPDLLPGDIVIAERTAIHDFGDVTNDGMKRGGAWNPINHKQNPLFFPANERLLKLSETAKRNVRLRPIQTSAGERQPRLFQGVVVTGDVFVASEEKKKELREQLGADAVEMEGAAVAQVCHGWGVPCLVIRSISDLANENVGTDMQSFGQIAAENSAQLVMSLVEAMQESNETTERPTK